MPYSTPRTWITGEVVTAAEFNQEIRDNLGAIAPLGAAGWTSYVPTLTQSATVTKTVNYANYYKVGRLVVVEGSLGVTGSGTGANGVIVGLPVVAVYAGSFMVVGSGYINDSSAAIVYCGVAALTSTATVAFYPTTNASGTFLGQSGFSAALAAGDVVSYSLAYESAT